MPSTQCLGIQLQTCTLVNTVTQWYTPSCGASANCTAYGGNARCCSPDPVATTCNGKQCGTAMNNCGQSEVSLNT